MSASPGSHSGPKGAAVMIRGCIFSGNSESSVKYMFVLLCVSSVKVHRQRLWLDSFQCDIPGRDATNTHVSSPSGSNSFVHLPSVRFPLFKGGEYPRTLADNYTATSTARDMTERGRVRQGVVEWFMGLVVAPRPPAYLGKRNYS